jgi:hypothetical protein
MTTGAQLIEEAAVLPSSRCQLCDVPPKDAVYVDLWEAWQQPSIASRERAVEQTLHRHKRDWPISVVYDHFSHHPFVQPMPSGARSLQEAEEAIAGMQRRKNDLEILRFIGQANVVTAKQIAAEFWPHASKKSRSDQILAHQKLRELSRHHLVFGVHRVGEKSGTNARAQKAWFLGRAGAAVLDVLGPQVEWTERELWINRPPKLGNMVHDLGVTDIFIDLQTSTPELVELGGAAIRGEVFPGNFWASKHLVFPVRLPVSETSVGARRGSASHMRPDGFCSLGIQSLVPGKGASPAFDSFALPFFIENDRGHHPVKLSKQEIADIKAKKRKVKQTTSGQIAAYIALAADRGPGARFPQLEVDGYTPPLLFVTESPNRAKSVEGQIARDLTRVLAVKRAAVEHAAKYGYQGQPPIFIAARSEIAALGFNSPIFGLWDEEDPAARKPLFQRLAAASMPLVRAGVLKANTRLTIDPQGAAWKGEKR